MLSTCVWDGKPDGGGSSSDSNWQTGSNWVGDMAPVAGDDLIFPSSVTALSPVNNFAAGTAFGSILIRGAGYTLGGNAIMLQRGIDCNVASTIVNLPITLGAAQTVYDTGTMSLNGLIDQSGFQLTFTGTGTTTVNGEVRGAGGVLIQGSTVFAAANTYSGITTISGATLTIRHGQALGAADGTAGTGTQFTGSSGNLRLEGSIIVGNELLTASASGSLVASGTGLAEWGGSVTGSNSVTLSGNYGSLQVDGNVTLSNGTCQLYAYSDSGGSSVRVVGNITAPNVYLYAYCNYSGGNTVRVDGSIAASSYLYVQPYRSADRVIVNGSATSSYLDLGYGSYSSGVLELNGSITAVNNDVTTRGTLCGSGTLSMGTRTLTLSSGSKLNPGAMPGPGILRTTNVNLQPNANFAVELFGTTPGNTIDNYDQYQVTGSVTLAGTLNVAMGNGYTPVVGQQFTILANDGTDAISDTFTGLPEGSLITVGLVIFRISYVGGDGNDVVLTTNSAPLATAQISGNVFDDLDQNRARNGGELGMPGWTVYLDANNNSALDVDERRTVSDSNGDYVFPLLIDGTYTVRQILRTGWTQTAPTGPSYSHSVTLSPGQQVAAKDFGNYYLLGVAAGADQLCNEGQSVASSGSFTAATGPTWTATVDYGDGSGIQPLTLRPDKTFSLDHRYDDNGTFTITVRVTDNFGGQGTDTVQVTVNNVAPIAGFSNPPTTGAQATPIAFTFTAVEPSAADAACLSYRIDWGDGNLQIVEGAAGGVNASHHWVDFGNYAVRVYAVDKDGAAGPVANIVFDVPASDVVTINADAFGAAIDNAIQLSRSGGNAVVTVDGVTVLNTPLAALKSLILNGQSGNDTLTVDFSGGNPVPVGGLNFMAGGNSGDSMTLIGGAFGTIEHVFLNESDGRVLLDATTQILYAGLAPIGDYLYGADRVFTFNAGAETIELSNSGTAGRSRIDSTLGELVAFTNPTASLAIHSNGGDTINLQGLGSGFVADLDVRGDSDTDTVNVMGNLTTSGNLDVAASQVNINSEINAGGGNVTVVAGTGLVIGANVTCGGILTLTAGESAMPGDDLTIAAGAVVRSTGASVLLRAGDRIGLNSGASVRAAVDVTLEPGYHDIDGAGAADVSGTVDATGAIRILGGNQNDTVTVNLNTASLTGAIVSYNAGDGDDSLGCLLANGDLLWSITSLGVGEVHGIAFSNVENVTGGDARDRFALADGAGLTGTIDGGAGVDTLDYSAYTVSVLATLPTTGTGTAVNLGGHDNIEDFVGGSANDSVVVAPLAAVSRNVSGGPHGAVPPGDSMTFDALGAVVTLGTGTVTASGYAPVLQDGFETCTISNYLGRAPDSVSCDSTTVAELEPVGTIVGTLTSHDLDTWETMNYSLVPGDGDTDNARFIIAGNQLKTAAVFDYETKSNYSIRIRVSDSGGFFLEEAFSISITDVNLAPTDIGLSNNSVAENQPSGTLVGTISTTDPEPPAGPFTYALAAGAGDTDNSRFTIVGGQLKTAASFDYETKNSYSVRIRATDAGSLSFEKVFNITVTDVNLAPTDIGLSNNSVAENRPSGTLVGTISTIDGEPPAGPFTYALAAGAGDTDNSRFTIVGGQLKTAGSFDYEAKNSYSIRIRTTDAGGLSFEKAFTISVANVDDFERVAVGFGGSLGSWIWKEPGQWSQLHTYTPIWIVSGDLDANGKADLVVNFGGSTGIWIYKDTGTWQYLHPATSTTAAMADIDGDNRAELILTTSQAGIAGVWTYDATQNTWAGLSGWQAEGFAVGDFDGNGKQDVAVDFGAGKGIWFWNNNTAWQYVHNVNPGWMAAGDLDGNGKTDLAISVTGANNIWARLDSGVWQFIKSMANSTATAADSNGDGRAELFVSIKR